MDFELGPEADSLRQRLRTLMEEHLPKDFMGGFTDDPEDLEATRRFCRLLAEEGLLTMAWPTEFGGAGASVWEQTVVREEMWANHEPRGPQYMSLNWIGPAIMRFGTPEQQRFHLPKMAAGEVLWCQGFSEPDAGSDLASLRTAARSDGAGGWRVDGQKIWTSYAQVADFCILAARTGTQESRHKGVSLFLVPMDRPGIEVRPIESVLGPYHLNEVFFDDVAVHADEILGTENDGWRVIREALAFERIGIARYARADRLLELVRRELGGISGLPTGLRARYARALVHTRVARLMAYEVIGAQAEGTVDDASAAAARIATVLGDQEVAEVLLEAIGPGFFASDPKGVTHLFAAVEDYWRYSRSATVAAGSVDIQRGLVARATLQRSA
ncbi:MAG TPA: acyl-CoA dehydrogenase family protein [Acidimicrobiales bacterium]|nr:acyl-CoA dehydrogenase family protein [Acidimicrobiales bacterium]